MDACTAKRTIDLAERRQGFEFSPGQRKALELTLTSPDQVVGVVGAAGAGKTTAVKSLIDAARNGGFESIGLAPQGLTADSLREAGADDTRTLQSSNMMKVSEDAPPRLIVLDEAGVVGDRDMATLLSKLRPEDRLVLVGDPKQLQPVEAGAPFKMMMNGKAIRFAEILEIQRQKDPKLLEIAKDFAHGRTLAAVEKAEKYMQEVEATDQDWTAAGIDKAQWVAQRIKGGKTIDLSPVQVRRQAIARETAAAYLGMSPEDRQKTLMLAATNETRRSINDRVRAGLKIEGVVDSTDHVITALQKSDMTKAQMKQAHQYCEGQIVRMRECRGKTARIVDYEITSIDSQKNTITTRSRIDSKVLTTIDLNKNNTSQGKLYTPRDMQIAHGDRLVILENDKQAGVRNGMVGTVQSVVGNNIQMIDDKGNAFSLDANRAQAVDHAWALTVHKSQGQTIDRVLVAGEGSRTATAESAYVACSRERQGLQIITDSTEMLKTRWEKYADRQGDRECRS